jgi:predicted dehydrogenase
MTLRIATIGFAHDHIYSITGILASAGAAVVSYFDPDDTPERVARFVEHFPDAKAARSIEEILEDASIDVITSATIPNQRAPLGIRAMQHGKDYLSAKPAFTSLEQLEEARRVQAKTGRMYKVFFNERFGNPATVKAGELVHAGAIGRVVQTVGFGPHRLLNHGYRPVWVFDRQYFGGVINDLASHQMDQFLYFTGSTEAEVVSAHVGNFRHTQFPEIHDYGDATVRSSNAVGHVRVDWMTPPGLNTWGDVRLFILGTDGCIELRKNIDLAGREGANHLFIVDQQGTRYLECDNVPMPFASQFLEDVRNRTETAVSQAHTFLACELALKAELTAVDLTADAIRELSASHS